MGAKITVKKQKKLLQADAAKYLELSNLLKQVARGLRAQLEKQAALVGDEDETGILVLAPEIVVVQKKI